MSTAALSQQSLRKPITKRFLLGFAALRAIVGVAAIPLAPFLY